MKKKPSVTLWLTMIWLTLCCLLSAVLLVSSSLRLAAAGLLLFLLCAACLFLLRLSLRRGIKKLLAGDLEGSSANLAALQGMFVPAAVVNENRLLWYNDAFKEQILAGEEAAGAAVAKLLPMLEPAAYLSAQGQWIQLDQTQYTVYGAHDPQRSGATVLYLVENTSLKWKAAEYDATRPAVLHILLDTYDELKRDLRTADLGRITGAVQDAVMDYVAHNSKGFVIRVASDRFLAVVEDRHIDVMIQDKFSVLDTVRKLGGEMGMTTLSIGVSRGAATLAAAEEAALTALDLALGRGGDQAAVREKDSYAFYGGVSHSVEKRSRVKARIIASSLAELVQSADNVVIMGHRLSDMDCLGAAAGLLRICKVLEKPACIAINKTRTLAGSMIRRLEAEGLGDELVTPEAVLPSVGKNTLLLIVDTHVPGLLESRELFEAIPRRVVIDHHRKMVGFIDDAIIFYHESYASSACELVTELLPYLVQKADRMLPVEAEALLAGIMLDTRDFTVHTGVRTFEAAGYLRRMGAQTANVKQLFAGTLEAYTYKAQIVSAARVYRGCAVAASTELPETMRVVIPQAANDLLGIEGVHASFVAVQMGDTVNISARSMGAVNVQVIMEKLQGGGHLMMAGTQLKDIGIDEAQQMLKKAIDEYWAQQQ